MAWLAGALAVGGCAGTSAEAPLTIPLGLARADAERALAAHQYCPRAGEAAEREMVYPRCDRPAAEWGDSWVTAIYDGDQLVELRRWERYADDQRATQRWNQLVFDRAKSNASADDADQALRTHGLQPGTRAVKVFHGDGGAIVGVYLLTPQEPDRANVLERIVKP